MIVCFTAFVCSSFLLSTVYRFKLRKMKKQHTIIVQRWVIAHRFFLLFKIVFGFSFNFLIFYTSASFLISSFFFLLQSFIKIALFVWFFTRSTAKSILIFNQFQSKIFFHVLFQILFSGISLIVIHFIFFIIVVSNHLFN